ncbi:MAG: hypothetical protein AMXMBFR44_4960 [Candidatus Campbellbacteria bacterium]
MFRKFTSERVRRVRRRRLAIFSVIYGLLTLSVFLVLWQLSLAPFWRIDVLEISGTRAIPHQDIFDFVTERLYGGYGGVFSKRNALIAPRASIQNGLVREFPRIRKVDVDAKDFHTLEIEITEHEPEALVCNTGSSTCYFVNEEGYVFDEAPRFLGDSYVTYSAHLVDDPLGKWFLAHTGGFAQLHAFVESLERLSLFPRTVVVAESSFTVSARVRFQDIQLLFSRSLPYDESFLNLEAILREEDFSVESVASIDLRFGNKVFFKPRAEVGGE